MEPQERYGIVVCVASQKGGVGKTTLAMNLASAMLHNAGAGTAMRDGGLPGEDSVGWPRRVLLIDMDPQASLSSGARLVPESYSGSAGALLEQALDAELPGSSAGAAADAPGRISDEVVRAFAEVCVPVAGAVGERGDSLPDGKPAPEKVRVAADAPVEEVWEGLDALAAGLYMVPAHRQMSRLFARLMSEPGAHSAMYEPYEVAREIFDLIIVDLRPDLGQMEEAALTSADGVIYPVSPEPYALLALRALDDFVGTIQKRVNPDLVTLAAVISRADDRSTLTEEAEPQVARFFPETHTQVNIQTSSALTRLPLHPSGATSVFGLPRNVEQRKSAHRSKTDFSGLAHELYVRLHHHFGASHGVPRAALSSAHVPSSAEAVAEGSQPEHPEAEDAQTERADSVHNDEEESA